MIISLVSILTESYSATTSIEEVFRPDLQKSKATASIIIKDSSTDWIQKVSPSMDVFKNAVGRSILLLSLFRMKLHNATYTLTSIADRFIIQLQE